MAAPKVPAETLDVVAVHREHADFVWRSLQRLGVRPSISRTGSRMSSSSCTRALAASAVTPS